MQRAFISKYFFIIVTFISLTAATAFAQSTAFNFQGRLNDGANPANGNFEMQFKLYDALTGGAQVGATLARPAVVVINGIFTIQLDFGAAAFDGAARFVEIGVRPAGSTNGLTTLLPRQSILATPYAIQAKNAQQLGGIDASQYVTTTTVGSSFIKNGTTLQTGNFNISGDGIVGNSLGIGITPSDGYKLDVNGNQRLTIAAGRTITFASPNGETGMSTIAGSGRADIRFDGTTLKLVAGTVGSVPPSTNGIVIDTSGNVGIGTLTPTGRLSVFNGNSGVTAIFGESQLNRGVWGKSFSSRGVYGESNSSQGIFGISVSGAGVMGTSTSSSGVYGETSIASPNAGGVFGKGLVSDSLGVVGESNFGTVPVGVYGITSNPTGFGVFARNTTVGGRALYADGNVAQNLSANGMIKAMLYVQQDGVILRCYNGVTNTSSGNCGFDVTRVFNGAYRIDFHFQVNDRFLSVTPRSSAGTSTQIIVTTGANFTFNNVNINSPTQVLISTFVAATPNSLDDVNFMVIVY